MAYTLAKAATAVGRDRSSILRAIKSGKLSAVRDEASGAWLIEPSELHRLYPPADAQGSAQPDAEVRTGDSASDAEARTDESAPEIRELRALLEQERQERRRERADRDTVITDKDAVIEDLRRRLDAADEERRLTLRPLAALLTDQRARTPFWRFWRRR